MVRDPEKYLATWRILNEKISELSEDDCWDLIEYEKNNKERIQVILRLYGRAGKLRGVRERHKLFQ